MDTCIRAACLLNSPVATEKSLSRIDHLTICIQTSDIRVCRGVSSHTHLVDLGRSFLVHSIHTPLDHFEYLLVPYTVQYV